MCKISSEIVRKRRSRVRMLTAVLLCLIMAAGSTPAFALEDAGMADARDAGQTVEETAEEAAGENAGEIPAATASEVPAEGASEVPAEGAAEEEPGNPQDPQDPAQEEPDPYDSWTPEDGLPRMKKVSVSVLNRSQILLTWKPVDVCDGYQVQYAGNILFLRAKKKTVKKAERGDLTISSLKTGGRYYVRIRSFRYCDGKKYTSEWKRVSTKRESADASIQYARRGKRLVDVRRQAGSRLSGYDIAQGTCSDGKYLYMAFEKRNGDDNGSGRARIKIAKVRIAGWKLVKVSPSGQKLGHANDITYNKHKRYLVVTGAKTNDPYVRIVSPKTLKKTGGKRIRLNRKNRDVKAFNAIAYDPKTRTYLIRSRFYGARSFVLDQSFRQKSMSIMSTAWPSRHVQSCTIARGHLILTQSWNQSKTKNTLTIFDSSGKRLQNIRLKLSGELESVFMIGRELYATVHKKLNGYKTGYIFRILL